MSPESGKYSHRCDQLLGDLHEVVREEGASFIRTTELIVTQRRRTGMSAGRVGKGFILIPHWRYQVDLVASNLSSSQSYSWRADAALVLQPFQFNVCLLILLLLSLFPWYSAYLFPSDGVKYILSNTTASGGRRSSRKRERA